MANEGDQQVELGRRGHAVHGERLARTSHAFGDFHRVAMADRQLRQDCPERLIPRHHQNASAHRTHSQGTDATLLSSRHPAGRAEGLISRHVIV
jgi:hypothetical protein